MSVISPPSTSMDAGYGVAVGVVVAVGGMVGVADGNGVGVWAGVADGKRVAVGNGTDVFVGRTTVVGSGGSGNGVGKAWVTAWVGANTSVTVGITGALAVASTAGTRVSSAWALAAAVAPHGWSVASNCTATVDMAAATSSRVHAVCASNAPASTPMASRPTIRRTACLTSIVIGLPCSSGPGCLTCGLWLAPADLESCAPSI